MAGDRPKGRKKKGAPEAAPDAQPEGEESEALTGEIVDGHGDDVGEPTPEELAASDLDASLPEGELEDHALVPTKKQTLVPKRSERSLTRTDPLTRYMQEIRRYPLLSREEEHELAVKYVKTGDVEAGRRLITANLRLVVKIAHEYRRAYRNLLDLVQEGNVGLVQAVEKYDPYRGVKLSSYAAWWIRAYMLKFILNNWRLVKIGTTQAQRKLFFNLRKEKEKLEAAGFAPTPKMLAQVLDVPEQEVIDMEKRLGQGEMSLDAPMGTGEESQKRTYLDMLESGDARPDSLTEGAEFHGMLKEKLAGFEKTLRGRELTIFRERLLNESPKTLQEIGESYGISRERARQLEARLLEKLKAYLSQEMGDAVQIAMGLEE